MRHLPLIICFVSCLAVTFSCNFKNNDTLEYSRLQYDTSSLILFKWDTIKYTFPKNSDPLPLTQDDIVVTDSILKVAVDSFNKTQSPGLYESFNKQVPMETFIINLNGYKRQYFPYRDVNGQKIIYITCFCDKFKGWKKRFTLEGYTMEFAILI